MKINEMKSGFFRRAMLLALAGMLLFSASLPNAAKAAADQAQEVKTISFKRLKVQEDAEYIDLNKVVIEYDEYQKFYEFLAKLPHLKRVDMFATRIPAKRINQLVEKFPQIEFGWTMAVGNHSVRTDAIAFTTSHNDQSARHATEDFAVLKYCKNLMALDIGHNAVKDLSFLYDLPNLRILILADNQFQDLTPIASLTELEYLELFYNDIRDVSALTTLTNLKDLNLGWNRIPDISPLESMTWLERLWVPQFNSHNVTKKPDPEAVRKLMEALPDTLVDATAKSSVENGWRKHTRYENMRQIFKTNTWIPLDTPIEK